MSQQSRSQLKNFIRTGQFSKRNAEADRLSDIPEEKVIDGRPASHVRGGKHESISSTVSDLSTSSTQVGHGPVDPVKHRTATHSPQAGDLLFVPPDIRTPTTFGPNNEYTAVPSVVTYSASGRGATRVTIREATPEEALELPKQHAPIPTEPPPYPQNSPAGAQSTVPILAPPPDFTPVRPGASPPLSEHSQQTSLHTLSPRISQGSESIRTSATSFQSIRTSTASALDDSAIQPVSAGHSTPPNSSPAPAPATTPKQSSLGSWSPQTVSGRSSTGAPSMRAPFRDSSSSKGPGSTTHTYPISDFDNGTSQSRFSWHVSNTDRARNWFTRWFIEWWLMEIMSWFFSLVCMLIIFAVLLRHDGKQLPQWKLGISINAFISIFSGFAKSALLLPTAEALGQLKWDWFRKEEKKMMDFEVMDSASRGPWGSMVLLARTKGVTLASVGAAIILLSLPLDLFFQQIVSYPLEKILDPTSNATISRAIFYDPYQGDFWSDDSWGSGPLVEVEGPVAPFFFGNGSKAAGVQFDCPTGNCTYDPFYTLAADFQCKEMPTFLEFGCHNTSAEWMANVKYEGPGLAPNVTSCGYYMNIPDNPLQLMTGYEVRPDNTIGEVMSTRMFALSDVLTNELSFGGSVNFKDVKNAIVDFIIASTPENIEGARKNNTPVVHECEIHWVVKQLQSSVQSGILSEKSLKTLQFESDLESPWDPDNSEWYRADFSMTLDDPHSFTEGKSTFGMSNVTAEQIWAVWAEFIPATETLPRENSSIGPNHVLKYQWLTSHVRKVGNANLLWDVPNNLTDGLARQIAVLNQVVRMNTNSLRQRHDVAVGQAWKYVVIVHIRWVWITLPAALLLFSLIFLIVTVVRSSKEKDKVGIWKTSALAILFNGLGEDVQYHVGSGNHPMGYQRSKAKEMRVQLDDD